MKLVTIERKRIDTERSSNEPGSLAKKKKKRRKKNAACMQNN